MPSKRSAAIFYVAIRTKFVRSILSAHRVLCPGGTNGRRPYSEGIYGFPLNTTDQATIAVRPTQRVPDDWPKAGCPLGETGISMPGRPVLILIDHQSVACLGKD